MKLGATSPSKKKILVVSGCSHTQGTAFINPSSTKEIRGKIHYELASPQLKKFYNKEYTTPEWVGKNLTWGGKLFSLIKYDEFINLGYGGQGIDSVINSIQNYVYDKKDLINHLFVIQIPAFERKEVFYKKNNKYTRDTYINLVRSLDQDVFDFLPKDEYMSKFLDNIYEDSMVQIEYLNKLYHLQSYLEAKKATVRLLMRPFNKVTLYSEEEFDEYLDSHKDFIQAGWEKQLQKFPSPTSIYSNLNIVDVSDIPMYRTKYMKDPKIWNLAQAGLLSGDAHWTEEANFAFAKVIQQNLNQKDPTPLELIRANNLI